MDQGSYSGRKVILGMTGSIATFKSVEIVRSLQSMGIRVVPVMTRSAARFVGTATFEALCRSKVYLDMWEGGAEGELHVELAADASLVLVAPTTADMLSRMAGGRADDLLSALLLCAPCPLALAPAMHPRMWAHPATQRNVQMVQQDGRVQFIGPVVGQVANGDVGLGRMADPSVIVEAVLGMLGPKDLAGRHVVVSAGPTVEDLDPVRFLSNRSTGKMGFAIAARAAARGARVSLVSGPVNLATPVGVERHDVRSALDMQVQLDACLHDGLVGADALVMAAAVSDYRPAERAVQKRKRVESNADLGLVANPDLLACIGRARTGTRPVLVGFAVETLEGAALIQSARGKLVGKQVDVVVANRAQDAFGKDTNEAWLVEAEGEVKLAHGSKLALADRILDWVATRLEVIEA